MAAPIYKWLDISSVLQRLTYVDNSLYLSKRETSGCLNEGIRLFKAADYAGAVVALKKALCVDKYNQDAIYLLNYIRLTQSGTSLGNCMLDPSACCPSN